VKTQTLRRIAALLEVFGVYLSGVFVENQIERLLVHWRLISTANPFDMLTVHATNAELLVASRQLFLALILQYGSYFLLIIPINWWYRRRGRRAYGLTRGGPHVEGADFRCARYLCLDAVAGAGPHSD
jgi:hypothetical protein